MKKFQEENFLFVKYFNAEDDMTEGEARQQAVWVRIRDVVFFLIELFFT